MAMKLGTETGSLVNHVLSEANLTPIVGAGATVLRWSDRKAYEVVEVSKDGKKCVIQRYNAKCTRSNGEDQDWDLTELTEQKMDLAYRYKAWHVVTEYTENGKLKKDYSKINIRFGYKEEYYDPCF